MGKSGSYVYTHLHYLSAFLLTLLQQISRIKGAACTTWKAFQRVLQDSSHLTLYKESGQSLGGVALKENNQLHGGVTVVSEVTVITPNWITGFSLQKTSDNVDSGSCFLDVKPKRSRSLPHTHRLLYSWNLGNPPASSLLKVLLFYVNRVLVAGSMHRCGCVDVWRGCCRSFVSCRFRSSLSVSRVINQGVEETAPEHLVSLCVQISSSNDAIPPRS